MYDYPIDTSILPTVIIYWRNSTGETKRINAQTGTEFTDIESLGYSHRRDRNIILRAANSKILYPYVKYHEDVKLLELAQVKISSSRKQVAHNWKYAGERYFVSKEKKVYDINGNIKTSGFIINDVERFPLFKHFIKKLVYGHYAEPTEFIKFIGSEYYTIGNGRVCNIRGFYNIDHWFETSTPTRTKGKAQKDIDIVTAIELPERDLPIQYYTNDRYGGVTYSNERTEITYFECVNDEWFVLRHFLLGKNKKYMETKRTYFNNGKKILFASKTDDGWASARQVKSYNEDIIVNIDEAIEKCKKIKYAVSAFGDDKKGVKTGQFVVTALKFPEIEQMAKLGMTNEAVSAARDTFTKKHIKDMFGDYYNDKEKDFLKKVGLTRRQLSYVFDSNEDKWNRSSTLRVMRKNLGEILSHIDQTSFEKLYDGYFNITRNFGTNYERYYNIDGVDMGKFFKNLIRIGKTDLHIYQVARDAINQYKGLHHKPEINWYFDGVSDLHRAHDAITELRNAEYAERQALYALQAAERQKKEQEKMAKLDEKRKEWEYEDDQFIIRLPKTIAEIITEGSRQRICIGGYTTSHALGNTNLFFLRKKSDPDTPFYAIEMDNQKNIRQIHGFGNCWLGKNPEAIPTVVRWLRKNNIKCSEQILTCTSTGYGNEHLYCNATS